jgi:uncharacterized protein (DUF488 family)
METKRVFTIGHSTHSVDYFVTLLKRYHVDVLADVRSAPYSSRVPHFNRKAIAQTMREHGLEYWYLGAALGGRPADRRLYDAAGHVMYDLLAESRPFVEAMDRLDFECTRLRIALLCAEENPLHCHRGLLIAPALLARGVHVEHIRGSGRAMPHAEAVREEGNGQTDLFLG